MVRILYVLAFLGSIAAIWAMWLMFSTSTSAPQEASGAAIAVALAVIPYCLARSVQEMMRRE